MPFWFHLLSGGVSVIALILLILQFILPQGTPSHVRRAYVSGFLVLAVIVGNTFFVAKTKGLVWDLPFLVHTGLGMLFFAVYLFTVWLGHRIPAPWSLATASTAYYQTKRKHGSMGLVATLFLVLSLITAALIPHLRNLPQHP